MTKHSAINIVPIKALLDNYIWLIIHNNDCIAIDTGDDIPVLQYLTEHNLNLTAIWITHHHSDHTAGVANMIEHYPNAQVFAHKMHGIDDCINDSNIHFIDESDILDAFGYPVQVWQTAGHTKSHLSFVLDIDGIKHIFCGDTLFSAGCGRIFCGTVADLFNSFQKFNMLADNTLFYPAHEYTLNNLKFAQFIEPQNQYINEHLTDCKNLLVNNIPTLPTTLKNEKKINPFLKVINIDNVDLHNTDLTKNHNSINGTINTDDMMLIQSINHKSQTNNTTPLQLFSSLRRLKDDF